MNRDMIRQPKLTNFVFWIERVDQTFYRLSQEDASLFRHPNLERLRLFHVDFSSFEKIAETYFQHENLATLIVEDSQYSPDALNRIVSPSRNLKDVKIHDIYHPPFAPIHFLPILTPYAASLKVLRLEWRHHQSCYTPGFAGLDLSSFAVLRLLRIQPGILLGSGGDGVESYTTGTKLGLLKLVRSRFPPGLKILLLESLTIPPPPGPVREELDMVLSPKDLELIRCLIEHKQSFAPKLHFIFMYYLDEMVEPEELYELAGKRGIEICGLYQSDIIDPGLEYLDADTYISRDGE
ncbi:MAG: hypothetical protein Q9174_007189, partial [Haloplaca sp. 1 TL-2023]